jgi:hypothetical protein
LPDNVIVLVILEAHQAKQFREDFKSRFKALYARLSPELTDSLPASGAEESKGTEASLDISPLHIVLSKTIPSQHAVYIDTHNFHQLFSHLEITREGIQTCKGLIELSSSVPFSIFIERPLSHKQWHKLSEAALKADSGLLIFISPDLKEPFLVETALPSEPSLNPSLKHSDSKSEEEIAEPLILKKLTPTQLPKALAIWKKKPAVICLALPKIGNPFIRYESDKEQEWK